MASRKRWMRQPLSWRRGGAVALLVLLAVMAAALVLDTGGGADMEPIEALIERRGVEPVQTIVEAGRSARVVLLSDIHELPEPKRIAAAAVSALADGPGLDAVVLEVPSDEQPYIDAYLNTEREDATVLLNRAGAVQEGFGVPREFLEIYRAVWRVNQELGPASRVRIIAADARGWPPSEGASGEAMSELYAARAQHMLERMDQEILSRIPDARLLVFVDGYMTLQRVHGEARFSGGDPVHVEWLGEALRQRAGTDVRTVLIDASGTTAGVRRLPAYYGTALHRPLRRELGRDVGVRVDDTFSVVRDPILETSSPAMRLEIRPAGYVLREVADRYIFLDGGR